MESGFYDWMEADKGLSGTYAERTRRAFQAMTRSGVDWDQFHGGSPREAVRGYLAALKRAHHVHQMRACQKALNLYAEFMEIPDDGAWGSGGSQRGARRRPGTMWWPLEKQPRRRLDPYTPDELIRMRDAIPQGLKGLRWGAMLFLFAHTGLRKGEVWGMRAEDFQQERGAVFIRRPEKGGGRRYVLLPDTAWHEGSRLQRYLAWRRSMCGPTGPLWVGVQDGLPLTEDGFAGAMHEFREKSGVAVNFNRFRHTEGTVCEELAIPVEVKVRDWDHADPRATLHYWHGSLERRREAMARAGKPGYEVRQPGPPALAMVVATI